MGNMAQVSVHSWSDNFCCLTIKHVLQSGLSRELFDAWCEDRRNGVIIADFAVQGTLAREILGSPSHVITKAGAKACSAPSCLYSESACMPPALRSCQRDRAGQYNLFYQ